MKVKVCGIKHEENLLAIATLKVDWIGLNFYSKSKRFVETELKFADISIPKVGVFVNATLEYIREMVGQYGLSYVQLHGKESEHYCQEAQSICPVIKVFSIDEKFDFQLTSPFDFCDYFLFDTKCEAYGGSGYKFDWNKLTKYEGDIPFLLAGGIGPDDLNEIKSISHAQLVGVDINSKFEIEPGLKNVKMVSNFIQELKK